MHEQKERMNNLKKDYEEKKVRLALSKRVLPTIMESNKHLEGVLG